MATNCNDNLPSDIIKRSAIDSAGRLGSLYDAYRDCMLGQLNVTRVMQTNYSSETTHCEVIKGETNKRVNLFRLFNIEGELQLSIALNLSRKIGLGALIDYPHPICSLTRILYFYWVRREEHLSDNLDDVRPSIQSFMPHTSATHIVTGVSWGIHAVVILKLQSDEIETVNKIDTALTKIRSALKYVSGDLTLDIDDEKILETMIETKIYSNAPELTRMTTLGDVYHFISHFKATPMNYPIKYTLRSIGWLCSEYSEQCPKFVTLPSALTDHLINDLSPLPRVMKRLEIIFNDSLSNLLYKHLQKQLHDTYKQWLDVNNRYSNTIQRLSEIVIRYRCGCIDIQTFKNTMNDTQLSMLKECLTDLVQKQKDLEAKGHFINDLLPFKYCNVSERGIDESDTEESINQKLIIDEQHDRVLCTNDFLNKKQPDQLLQWRQQLTEDYDKNTSLRLIYADFTDCSFPLNDMTLLPLIKIQDDNSLPKQKNTSSSIIIQPPSPPPDIINILLLGETGVGKSTFINALVNYLTFDSFQTAESRKPIVLIPVSFLLTAGNSFEEFVIKLDNIYQFETEHFNTFGQSVTQYCKSYLLHLKHDQRRQIRIIDTPGFGDTRGLEQDDRNMQQILEYINNLTHLNAICFLFKPNADKLNLFFRSCLTQLLEHLGPKVEENIIFCFTNTRATFFTPGNTAPILKNMLHSSSMDSIPFKKENTFCFESEAFRYLVALQNAVPCEHLDKNEYKHSWLNSTKESNRLINYICTNLTSYEIRNQWQSMKRIQFEIIHMIRPMLEAMRNSLRNILLSVQDSQKISIKLCPKPLYRIATRCLECKPNPIQVAQFFILPDFPHEIQNTCLTCQCSCDQHTLTEYYLEYQLSDDPWKFEELENIISVLFDASVEFAYFLLHTVRSTKDDPFLIGLAHMINKEKTICEHIHGNDLNSQLVQQLEIVIRDYQRKMSEMTMNQQNNDLSLISNRIKSVCELPMVCEQMAAIQQGRDITMKNYEFDCEYIEQI